MTENTYEIEKSDFYMGNPNLLKAGTKHAYTKEQVEEIIKCKEDPIYFIKTYCKIINVDEGLIPFKLYPYQEQFVRNLKDYRNNVVCFPRQSGKCLVKSGKMKVKCKSTGEIKEITAEDFFNTIKNNA